MQNESTLIRKLKQLAGAVACGLLVSTAGATHFSGKVVCGDTSPATPLVGVVVTAIGANGTFTGNTDTNGNYLIPVVNANDTYTLTITVPNGLSLVTPVGGSYVLPISTYCGTGTGQGICFWDGVDFVLTGCAPVGPGTGTPGYWKNHPGAWPVNAIQLGCHTYTKAQAITLMSLPDAGDKTRTVFRHLVCAKLNVIIGNVSACIDGDIVQADLWLCAHPINSHVAGSSAAWEQITGTATKLDQYNNGLLCAPHRD
ncbi:MAG: hypothetical protein EXS35_04425 [Pedosphaera sp.]|nr:hypothetical protein [Pedosphaera sp.]